jgi:hypothetical protein
MVVASGGEARNLTSARRPKAVSGGMALRGDAAYQWQARRLLSEVQLKLGRLDRATLDPNKIQTSRRFTPKPAILLARVSKRCAPMTISQHWDLLKKRKC